jgi:methionine synthase I (cobalamin-dependent)
LSHNLKRSKLFTPLIEAGANIVETNTFSSTTIGMADYLEDIV